MAQILTVSFMPLITRLYSPEIFGVLSLYLAFFNFASTLQTLRYDKAILISDTDTEVKELTHLSLICTVLMCFLAFMIVYLLSDLKILGFELLEYSHMLILLLALFFMGVFNIYRSILLKNSEVKSIASATFIKSLANNVSKVSIYFTSLSSAGLLLGELIGVIVSAFYLFRRNSTSIAYKFSSILDLKAVAKKYSKFALIESPSVFINQLSIALLVPMVASLYGASAAGWFGLARLIYGIPNTQIGQSAGDVFQTKLAFLYRLNKVHDGKRLFYKFSTILALIGLIPLSIAFFLSEDLVPIVFGEEWKNMGILVAIISPWMYCALIASSMSRALSVMQAQHLKLFYDILSLGLTVLAYYLAARYEFDLFQFVELLTVFLTISYIFYYLLIAYSFISRCRQN